MKKLIFALLVLNFYSSSYCQPTLRERELMTYNDYMDEGKKFLPGEKFSEAKVQYEGALKAINDATRLTNIEKSTMRRTAQNKIDYCTAKIEEQKRKPIIPLKLSIVQAKKTTKNLEPKKQIKVDSDVNNQKIKLSACEEQNRNMISELTTVYDSYANELLKNKDIEKAKVLYTKVLQNDSEDESALKNISKIDYDQNKNNPEILFSQNNVSLLLYYFEYSLDDKNDEIAKKIEKRILEIQDDVVVRDKIGNLYFEKTGVSHFTELFMSDPDEININYEYFTYYKVFGETNLSKREYYDNLIQLSLAYMNKNKDIQDSFLNILSTNYNSLGWYCILTKKFDNTMDYFEQSKKYNKYNKYPDTNIPHVYLFTNHYEQAKKLYLDFKNLPFKPGTIDEETYRDAFLADFKSFEEAKVFEKDSEIEKQVNEIKTLLR